MSKPSSGRMLIGKLSDDVWFFACHSSNVLKEKVMVAVFVVLH